MSVADGRRVHVVGRWLVIDMCTAYQASGSSFSAAALRRDYTVLTNEHVVTGPMVRVRNLSKSLCTDLSLDGMVPLRHFRRRPTSYTLPACFLRCGIGVGSATGDSSLVA